MHWLFHAEVSYQHGLCKNMLRTAACPACILFLVDVCQFLSLLLAVPGLHDGSSTNARISREFLCASMSSFFADWEREGYGFFLLQL